MGTDDIALRSGISRRKWFSTRHADLYKEIECIFNRNLRNSLGIYCILVIVTLDY